MFYKNIIWIIYLTIIAQAGCSYHPLNISDVDWQNMSSVQKQKAYVTVYNFY